MDPKSIFVTDLPNDLTYRDIKSTFCPFQKSQPLEILKKEHFIIITFTHTDTMQRVLKHKDSIQLKGKNVTITQAFRKFKPRHIHLPFSFLLPIDVLFPPLPPPPIHFLSLHPPPSPPSPPPPPPSSAYRHPFPEGFSLFYYKYREDIIKIKYGHLAIFMVWIEKRETHAMIMHEFYSKEVQVSYTVEYEANSVNTRNTTCPVELQ